VNKKLFYGIIAVLVIGIVIIFSMIGVKMYSSKKISEVSPGEPTKIITATPENLIITTAKIELYNSTTDSWITIHDGYDYSGDLAKNGGTGVVEKAMKKYLGNKPLPNGTYTKVRSKNVRGSKIKASASYGGVTYYTTTSNKPFMNGGQAIVLSTTGPAQLGNYMPPYFKPGKSHGGKFEFKTNRDYATVVFNIKPFTITKPEDTSKLKFKFDWSGHLSFDIARKICWPEHGGILSITIED